MNTVDLLVTALATWQTVEIWQHGSIFAGWRAWFEVQNNFLAQLLGCPFCLSVWVAGFWVGWLMLPCEYFTLASWPMYLLAVSRLANLGNDQFKSHYRITDEFEIHEFLNEEELDENMTTGKDTTGQAEQPEPTEKTTQQQPTASGVNLPPGFATETTIFDDQIVDTLTPAINDVLLKHSGTLRSVGVFFDFHGPLNGMPEIKHGMLVSAQGTVAAPDAVIGSLQACITVMEELITRAASLESMYREHLTVIINELNQSRDQHEELQTKIKMLENKKKELETESEQQT